MASWTESVLKIPSVRISDSPGLSVDLGSSVVKIAYRSKEDYDNGKPKTQGQELGSIHLVQGSPCVLEKMLSSVLGRCDISESQVAPVSVCGKSAASLTSSIQDKVKAGINVLDQDACFAKAFAFLAGSMSMEEVFYPPCPEAIRRIQPTIDNFNRIKDQIAKLTEAQFNLAEGEVAISQMDLSKSVELPCILVLCGKQITFLKVEQDGRSHELGSIHGGSTFMGLMAAFTGVSDFDKAIQMVKQGDVGKESTVDTYYKDLVAEREGGGEDDLYSMGTDDELVFPFGKLVTTNIESVKLDDLAFSFLNVRCMDIVQVADGYGQQHGIRHICFAGSFIDSDVARTLLTMQAALRGLMVPPEGPAQFYYVRYGGLLGAVGAFLDEDCMSPKTHM